MHFYQSYPIKVPIFRVPKKKTTKILYTQETVNPKIWTPKKYHEHGYRKCLWVSLRAPSLGVKYIINQLTRLTIMANCLIIHLSLGHSSFIRFTPRNSHFLLFHMPVIMLNRLFRLPQTKSQVYPNRSFGRPWPDYTDFLWLAFWSRDFNTAKFWHVHQKFWQQQTDQSEYKPVVLLYIQCNTLMYGTVFSSAIDRLELYRTSGCCTRYTVLQL